MIDSILGFDLHAPEWLDLLCSHSGLEPFWVEHACFCFRLIWDSKLALGVSVWVNRVCALWPVRDVFLASRTMAAWTGSSTPSGHLKPAPWDSIWQKLLTQSIIIWRNNNLQTALQREGRTFRKRWYSQPHSQDHQMLMHKGQYLIGVTRRVADPSFESPTMLHSLHSSQASSLSHPLLLVNLWVWLLED